MFKFSLEAILLTQIFLTETPPNFLGGEIFVCLFIKFTCQILALKCLKLKIHILTLFGVRGVTNFFLKISF